MAHIHDPDDLEYLTEFEKEALAEFAAWARLDGIVAREDGTIPGSAGS